MKILRIYAIVINWQSPTNLLVISFSWQSQTQSPLKSKTITDNSQTLAILVSTSIDKDFNDMNIDIAKQFILTTLLILLNWLSYVHFKSNIMCANHQDPYRLKSDKGSSMLYHGIF